APTTPWRPAAPSGAPAPRRTLCTTSHPTPPVTEPARRCGRPSPICGTIATPPPPGETKLRYSRPLTPSDTVNPPEAYGGPSKQLRSGCASTRAAHLPSVGPSAP